MLLKSYHKPLGDLQNEGYLNQSRLAWAATKAYDQLTKWPFCPYKDSPMGMLIETRQISLRELAYAIKNAWDEGLREAAKALLLVRLDQAVNESAPSAGVVKVISRGNRFAQRKQYQLTFHTELRGDSTR